MVTRQLKKNQHEQVYSYLTSNGTRAPFTASYDMAITINGDWFLLRLQLARSKKYSTLIALQAIKVNPLDRNNCQIITHPAFLRSLTELVLFQIFGESEEEEFHE